MRLVRSRPLLAGLLGTIAVVTPVVVSQLGSSPTSAASPDTIQYVQTTGSGGTYVKYVPGDGSTPTSQSVTGSGGCATPSVHGTPILAFNARLYPNADYSGSPTAAVVGAYKQRTGVCAIPQAWSIENTEALDFAVGSNALTTGRIFARAQIEVQRQDKGASPSVTVQLVEWLNGTQKASQLCVINGPQGTTLLTDTDTAAVGATCTGQDGTTSGFDTIEIRELTVGGSISVVGPTSTFTLANEICGGQTITTTSSDGVTATGQVSVSLTLNTSPSVCKSYTAFVSSANDPNAALGTTKSVSFDSLATLGTPFTVTVDWGTFPQCSPQACSPFYVAFDNVTFSPETFCATATQADPLCVTSKKFEYVSISGTTYTHITETWSGLNDWAFRG